MSPKQVTLLTRHECHLCDDARIAVTTAIRGTDAIVTETDVDSDLELRAEYGDMVPVVLVDGVQHGFFTIDPARLHRVLLS